MRIIGCCLLLVHDGLVMMGHNLKRQGWEFTGGKPEPGETMRQALAREVYEETGISIDENEPEFIGYVDEEDDILCLVFVQPCLEKPKPRIREPDTCSAWAWVPLGKLKAIVDLTQGAALVAGKFHDKLRDRFSIS